ncbi:MAG: hypothetical protein LBR72_00250 [Oscillospiraceae bacterium]|jgi:hypothetical protein|nr:hypothetical protein [Oscillospiraceae bacterium]
MKFSRILVLALMVTLLSGLLLTAAAEPVIADGYTILKTAYTDPAAATGTFVYQGEKMTFKAGQSVYFLADVTTEEGPSNWTNEGVVQAFSISNGTDTFVIDLTGGTPGFVAPKTQGEGGLNFVYTYAPVQGMGADLSITDYDAYYGNLMDNIGELVYDPTGPLGFGGGFGAGWRPANDAHNNYAGVLTQLMGWFQPDLLADGTLIRPGIRVDIPADGEYEVTWYIYNANAGVSSAGLMVVSDAPGEAAPPAAEAPADNAPAASSDGGAAPANPKTADPFSLLAVGGVLLIAGVSSIGLTAMLRKKK